jgi:hypothetical protein
MESQQSNIHCVHEDVEDTDFPCSLESQMTSGQWAALSQEAKAEHTVTSGHHTDVGPQPNQEALTRQQEASQRQRGRAARHRSEYYRNHGTQNFRNVIPGMVEVIRAFRGVVEEHPEKVDPGCLRLLKEFSDDDQLAQIVSDSCPEASRTLFIHCQLPARERTSLPRVWCSQDAAHQAYPSRQDLYESRTGLYKRGVYWILMNKSPVFRDPNDIYRHYVGSGRSPKGGMLLRAVEHSDAKYREEHPKSGLYSFLGKPDVKHKICILSEWAPIEEYNPGKEETFDEILFTEALWQALLCSGDVDNMSGLASRLENALDQIRPAGMFERSGINVRSALEPPYPERNNKRRHRQSLKYHIN